MGKGKTIRGACSICNKQITVEIDRDLAENKSYYPFEYIHVHGDPLHCLIFYLDKNLSVRDTTGFSDINLAKQKSKEFDELTKMNENELFYSIYTDPLRLLLLDALIEGPKEEDQLMKLLSSQIDFKNSSFNKLILPFIKTGILKLSWMQGTLQEVYFLTRDFIAFRIPPRFVIRKVNEDPKFKSISSAYIKKVNETVQEFQNRFKDGKDEKIDEIRDCLKHLSQYKYSKLYYILRKGPQTSEMFNKPDDQDTLKELVKEGHVLEVKVKIETYYILLNDIKFVKFIPEYLLPQISENLKNKKINREMARKHLELLYAEKV